MKFILTPLIFLSLFWLALSGHYTGLLLSLGAASCIWVTLIARRMDVVDHEGHPVQNVSLRILPYYIWLGKEVILSSIAVARMILSSGARVNPEVIRLPVDGMSDMEKVIYANSITLTPGTLTIDVDGDWLEVHTVRGDLLEPLKRGVMADRVRRISTRRVNRS